MESEESRSANGRPLLDTSRLGYGSSSSSYSAAGGGGAGAGAKALVDRAVYDSDPAAMYQSVSPVSPTWKDTLDPSRPLPEGTVKGSIFTLLSTIIGGGVLSLPFTFAGCGLGLGVFLTVAMALASSYSANLLVWSAHRSGGESYEDIAHRGAFPFVGEKATTKQLSVLELPEVLCFHLKRWRAVGGVWFKNSRYIEFPMKGLDMSPFLPKGARDPDGRTLYDLSSIICHHGTVRSGHYTAYCYDHGSDQWLHFDDQHVTPVEPRNVQTPDAYILIYRRKSLEESSPAPMDSIPNHHWDGCDSPLGNSNMITALV